MDILGIAASLAPAASSVVEYSRSRADLVDTLIGMAFAFVVARLERVLVPLLISASLDQLLTALRVSFYLLGLKM